MSRSCKQMVVRINWLIITAVLAEPCSFLAIILGNGWIYRQLRVPGRMSAPAPRFLAGTAGARCGNCL